MAKTVKKEQKESLLSSPGAVNGLDQNEQFYNEANENVSQEEVSDKETEDAIVVFSQEQLELLTADTRNAVVALEEGLPKKELAILNPLVSKLIALKAKALTVKYVPKPEVPEGGKADPKLLEEHKKSIDDYKEFVNEVKEVKSAAAAAKKAIKGPLDDMGKQVLVVERGVVEVVEKTLAEVDVVFADWHKAEEDRLAKEREKRAAKASEAIAQVSSENESHVATIKKTTVVNFLKYEILEPVKAEVNIAVEKYSLEELFKYRDSFSLKTFDAFSAGQDLSLLDEEEINIIKAKFETDLSFYKQTINTRIRAVEALKDKEIAIAANEGPLSNAAETMDVSNTTGGVLQFGGGFASAPPAKPGPTMGMGNMQRMFKQEMVADITRSIETGKTIIQQYHESFAVKNENPTAEAIEEIRRMSGGIKLLEKTIQYINNQLPAKENGAN